MVDCLVSGCNNACMYVCTFRNINVMSGGIKGCIYHPGAGFWGNPLGGIQVRRTLIERVRIFATLVYVWMSFECCVLLRLSDWEGDMYVCVCVCMYLFG